LVSPNITAHLYGIDSAEIEDSIEAVDGQIGKLLKKLDKMGWSNYTLIVIASDHGMNERPIGIDIITSLKKRGHKDIVENILYLSEGATGGVYINNTKPAIVKITVEAIKEIDHVNEVWYKYDDKAPWYIQKFAHERTPDILIIPDANSVILEEGEIRPQVSTNHGPPYPPDINIWLIFSGVGVKKLGKVGDMLDYSSKKLISDKEIKELPVQWDIAPTVKDIWGIEE
jgi:predicted AlkP superfamily pyrophosphatase or phosphodiesterase